VAVTACTARAWVRGVVELGRLRRLSELVNQAAAGYLIVLDGEILPTGAQTWPSPRPRLYLNKADVLFVYPTPPGEGERPAPALSVKKVHVQGQVHLADRVPWEQFLSVLRDRFLAVTDATVTRAANGDLVAAVDFVAVSRDHLTALYPLE
jgi:hypothetical protein